MNTVISMKQSAIRMNTAIQIFTMNILTRGVNLLIMGIILIYMTTVPWNIPTSIHLTLFTCTNIKSDTLYMIS